jgi:hypothetical protein
MPIDPYFSSSVPVPEVKVTALIEARWKAFQRLGHELQASEIDEILR